MYKSIPVLAEGENRTWWKNGESKSSVSGEEDLDRRLVGSLASFWARYGVG